MEATGAVGVSSRKEIISDSRARFGGSWAVRKDILGRFSFVLQLAPICGSTCSSTLHPSDSKRRNLLGHSCALLAAILLLGAHPPAVDAQNLTFNVPPVKIPFMVKDQAVSITASALISMVSSDRDQAVFKLKLTADLADLQQNMTGLLSEQLDKDDHCGDRISIEHASLMPADPASLATVQLHYERWACLKAFGKQQAKRLIAGNAVVPVKLTPGVAEDNTELRLVPEVGTIEADGSLGELLQSGTVGAMIREKVQAAILSAMQKGTNLSVTLPTAAQGYATIQSAEFKDAGSGRLTVVLDGQLRITQAQVKMLSKQLNEHTTTH
jgi:hypothetical protein